MAKCKYCDIPLKWKQPYTAGDRPTELNGKAHDCPKFTGKNTSGFAKFEKRIQLVYNDFEFCDMCARYFLTEKTHIKYPSLHYISMGFHKEKYHSSGEVLDDIDFMVITDEQKEKMRIMWNQPKRTTKYTLVGKRLY